jgi:hypothetical protein
MRKKLLIILAILVIAVLLVLYSQKYSSKPNAPINQLTQTASKEVATAPEQDTTSDAVIKEDVFSASEVTTTDAAIADIYQKDGSYYILLDYLTYVSETPSDTFGWENQSKKLRTFKIGDGAKLILLDGAGSPTISKSPAELYTIIKTDEKKNYYGIDEYNPNERFVYTSFEVKVKGDVLLALKLNYHD